MVSIGSDRNGYFSIKNSLFCLAVKCNDSPIVIKTLYLLGAGFDCASKSEINNVMSHGVAADSIIYAHPTKSISYLNYSAEMNVHLMTFDSDDELYKIHKHFPSAEFVSLF